MDVIRKYLECETRALKCLTPVLNTFFAAEIREVLMDRQAGHNCIARSNILCLGQEWPQCL
jgi:hypothetical protein